MRAEFVIIPFIISTILQCGAQRNNIDRPMKIFYNFYLHVMFVCAHLSAQFA
jgi:hypothetical protein